MIIIVGKTCSGKDTIVRELIKLGYKRIVTYTSRPMRKNEIDCVTYHFISEDDFLNKVDTNFFLEYKLYDTKYGTWYYGSACEDYEKTDEKTVVILTPVGYRDLLQKTNCSHKVFYIYANNNTIRNRLKKRGDSKEEAERRLAGDNEDFKGIEKEVTRIIYNNDGTNIDSVVEKIIKYAEE